MTAPQAGSTATRAPIIDREVVLEVRDLRVQYGTDDGQVKAVDGAGFKLRRGERFALVGESGSGKTTMAMALMRLTRPPGEVVGGTILLEGRDILQFGDDEIRATRLAEIALVQQGAMNSLNPVLRVGAQMIGALNDHGVQGTKNELRERIGDLLERVGLSRDVAQMYPHELSGGMKQRVGIATATSLNPQVIVADEPTSALDVVVQRQVMVTLGRLQEGLGAAVILVGHDMGLVAQFADTVGVMYAGKLVEVGPVDQIFEEPLHPYTKLLIESLPNLQEKRERLKGISGLPPALINLPPGCVFNPRCPSVMAHCSEVSPRVDEVRSGRLVACHLYDEAEVPS